MTVYSYTPGRFTGGRWCPEDREGYANGVSDCIEEMERLYSIK